MYGTIFLLFFSPLPIGIHLIILKHCFLVHKVDNNNNNNNNTETRVALRGLAFLARDQYLNLKRAESVGLYAPVSAKLPLRSFAATSSAFFSFCRRVQLLAVIVNYARDFGSSSHALRRPRHRIPVAFPGVLAFHRTRAAPAIQLRTVRKRNERIPRMDGGRMQSAPA